MIQADIHPGRQIITLGDKAISERDFDSLMHYYADDAALVVKPDIIVTGKANIRTAFLAISDHFQDRLRVDQGEIRVIEGGGNALVIMETVLHFPDAERQMITTTRRATYVFRKEPDGRWLCTIDNAYGTALLDSDAV